MTAALLDANVLLALAWPSHQHHADAHAWFETEAHYGWATIPLTQLAFVRLSSNPAYTLDAVSPREAAALLTAMLAHPQHRVWPSINVEDPTVFERAMGHRQVNDAYLVALAGREQGRVVTFDRRLVSHDPTGRVVTVIPNVLDDA